MTLPGIPDDKAVLSLRDIAKVFDRHPETIRLQVRKGIFPIQPWRGGQPRASAGRAGRLLGVGNYQWRRVDVERELQSSYLTARRLQKVG